MLKSYTLIKVVPFIRKGVNGKFSELFNTNLGEYKEVLVSEGITSVSVSIYWPGFIKRLRSI
jgi:hypothetical protein